MVGEKLGFIAVFAAVASLGGTLRSACAAQVTLTCGSVGKEYEVCAQGAQAWSKQTGHSVEVVSSPGNSGERLAHDQLLLAARSSDIDVFVIDTTWPGMMADYFVDLSKKVPAEEIRSHFPVFIQNNTVDGKFLALPWFMDAGVLYYRRDLLGKYGEKVPATWEQLEVTARKIQENERKAGNAKLWGFVFQARAYEGLTCNALEWIASQGGGAVIDPASEVVTIDNPQAVKALDQAARWVGTISPRGVLNSMEEEARGVFQSGNAVFMRNWPYAWKLAQSPDSPVKGKVGVSSLPRGGADGKSVGTLGGWSLAVSKYSKNPDAAIDLVRYLAGVKEQKRRAMELGQNPTHPSLYEDPELIRENPMLPRYKEWFARTVARPGRSTGTRYNRVSAEFYEAVHRTLSGRMSAQESLKRLSETLQRVLKSAKKPEAAK